jgi:hypothetical protein
MRSFLAGSEGLAPFVIAVAIVGAGNAGESRTAVKEAVAVAARKVVAVSRTIRLVIVISS